MNARRSAIQQVRIKRGHDRNTLHFEKNPVFCDVLQPSPASVHMKPEETVLLDRAHSLQRDQAVYPGYVRSLLLIA